MLANPVEGALVLALVALVLALVALVLALVALVLKLGRLRLAGFWFSSLIRLCVVE